MGPQHNLEFVEKMGGNWVTLAWGIVAAWWAITVLQIVMGLPQIMASVQSPGTTPPMALGNPIVSILGYAIGFGALIWMILDLIDRKGNWLWFVLVFCCCGLVTMPIYLLAGRK